MFKITQIQGFQLLDSRGFPTVAAQITLEGGFIGFAIVPSGASTGKREALELRDGGNRYLGKGVLKAVSYIDGAIKAMVLNQQFSQKTLDETLIELDGSADKSKLGANAILAVSLAFFKASAKALQLEPYALSQWDGFYDNFGFSPSDFNDTHSSSWLLPTPMCNVINGGAHADNNVDIQEFMIIPKSAKTFADALLQVCEVFHHLKRNLKQKGLATSVGDEGGFAPNLQSNTQALELLVESIEKAGYRMGKDISLSLDIASSEFYKNGKYDLQGERKIFEKEQWVEYLNDLVRQYPIMSIEDGMAEDDFEGWELLTEKLGSQVQLVGDDLFVTNSTILKDGIAQKLANAILIKPNQIGTLSETLQCIALAKKHNYQAIISHRSGESEDTIIADLSVLVSAGQIKTGSLSRSERVAKYNRLLMIEATLQAQGFKTRY